MNPPVLFISKNTTYTNLCNDLRHGVHYDATIGENVCNESDYSATIHMQRAEYVQRAEKNENL